MTARAKRLFFYGWILVAIAMLVGFLAYGVRFSFSVFFVAILKEFGWSRADTALIFSFNILVYGFTAPFAGALVDRLGPRKMMPLGAIIFALGIGLCSQARALWQFYLLFGIVAPFGMALMGYVPLVAVLSNWFVRRRALVFGMYSAGFGLCFLFSYVAEFFIATWGWGTAYIILGALLVGIFLPLLSIFMRRRPQEMGLLPDGDVSKTVGSGSTKTAVVGPEDLIVDRDWALTEWTVPRALRTTRFWAAFWASFFAWGIAMCMIAAHQVAFIVDAGFSSAFGALIYGLYGVFYATGGILGFMSDRIGREITFTIGCIGAMIGTIVLLLISIGNLHYPALLFGFAIPYGLGMGLITPTFTSCIADLFQGKNFGAINGCISPGFAIGGALGTWIGGLIFDKTASYTLAFVVALAAIALSCILFWVIRPGSVRRVPGKVPRRAEQLTTAAARR